MRAEHFFSFLVSYFRRSLSFGRQLTEEQQQKKKTKNKYDKKANILIIMIIIKEGRHEINAFRVIAHKNDEKSEANNTQFRPPVDLNCYITGYNIMYIIFF